jgi:transposase-like protein
MKRLPDYELGFLHGAKELIRVANEEFYIPKCKFCNSAHVVRFGHRKGVQRWWCKTCKRKFVDNKAMPGMKTPTEQIGSAVNTYYEGLSLNAVRRNLQQTYNNYPSDSTVYEWITRYTKEALKEADKIHPQVGGQWVVDETVVHRNWGGKKRRLWLIDIIDTDTRFLLATKLSRNRAKEDIKTLMEKAKEKAGKSPKEVWSDGWGGYRDGIELAFGADTKHVVTTPFGDADSSSTLTERWHGTLKDRTKVMRGLKTKETAQLILDGWLIHYNYFRPHEGLDGKTPAEKSNVQLPFKNWLDVVQAQNVTLSIPKVRLLRTPMPVFTPSHARISSPKAPRVNRRTTKSGLYVGKQGQMSRHYFRGARRVK